MSSNPYENEPGYENANSPSDKKQQAAYIAKIRHETLRVSVIQRMESYLGVFSDGTVMKQDVPDATNPLDETDEDLEENAATFEPFKDLCKRRFLWYYESYEAAIQKGIKEHKQGEQFKSMTFEGPGNTMPGKFEYPELLRRLKTIKSVLAAETARWAEEGMMLLKRESPTAAHTLRQFQQIADSYKKNDMVTLDVEMEGENPFVWFITYFGRPMTQLDGGMFRVRMTISPRFPDELPRVQFETPLFHHRVAKDGTVCYFPSRSGELQSHVKAIVEAIEEEHPPYDPRTLVNLEAAKLFWGSTDDKKQYNRLLRRAVQRSVDG
jgi:ubiquitin-conjugating enzyme E2 Z